MVKSKISYLTFGIIILLIIIIIFFIIMLNSKHCKKNICGKDEFNYCSMIAGSDIACGCLKLKGGKMDVFKRTNNIACGNNAEYVCEKVIHNKYGTKIKCGCMKLLDKNNPAVILPEEYLK